MGDDERGFECVFCQRPFKRHDALRRHWQTCHVRRAGELEVPRHDHKTRGRKPKACDRCVRLKRVCSATSPCTTCMRNEADCTYLRSQIPAKPQDEGRCTSTQVLEVTGQENESVYHDEYLASDVLSHNITASDDLIIDITQCRSLGPVRPTSNQAHSFVAQAVPPQTQRLLREHFHSSLLVPRPTQLDVDALKIFPFLGNLACGNGLGLTFERSFLGDKTYHSHPSRFLTWQPSNPDHLLGPIAQLQSDDLVGGALEQDATSGLEDASRSIIHVMRPEIEKHVGYDIGWGVALELKACEFFSSVNIERRLDLYWSHWHSNWPVIHKPSFSPSQVSPLLVVAMSVVGACLSPDPSDRVTAQLFFDILENLVFATDPSEALKNDRQGSVPTAKRSRLQLQTLQAAYCVVLFQTWEGDAHARKRARTYQYDRIVSMARTIGFGTATLADVDTSDEIAFDWSLFAHQESLIRTFAYIANLDSGLAMFYRRRPRMMMSDMTFDLSAPQAAFWAESPAQCYAILRSWRTGLCSSTNISLASAVNLMCSKSCLDHDLRRLLDRLSILDMFTIISALHSLAYHVDCSMASFLDTEPLRRGLHNWQRAWPSDFRDQEMISAAAESDWKRVGFFRYAPEYWLMTSLILQRAHDRWSCNPTSDGSICETDDADMSQLNAIIENCRSMDIPSIATE